MYSYAKPQKPAGARKTRAALIDYAAFWVSVLRGRRSLASPPLHLTFVVAFWALAMPLAGAVLVGGMAALAGLPPLEFALDFLGRAFVELSGIVANLLIIIFFVAALYYGVSPELPGQLLHRSLTAGIAARFTLLCALWTPHQVGGVALSANWHNALAALTRPSRVALGTASDLAGSAPRLE